MYYLVQKRVPKPSRILAYLKEIRFAGMFSYSGITKLRQRNLRCGFYPENSSKTQPPIWKQLFVEHNAICNTHHLYSIPYKYNYIIRHVYIIRLFKILLFFNKMTRVHVCVFFFVFFFFLHKLDGSGVDIYSENVHLLWETRTVISILYA